MSKSLEQWLEEDVSKCDKMSIQKLSHEYFFRDPSRPNYINHEYFYSPADGTILYQKIVQPDEKIVEIKGVNYTLKDVMGDKNFSKPSLVIGIFMSFYDVHINRIPYAGILKYEGKEPIESTNRPMLALEKDILNAAINPNNMDYMKFNERMINTIYSPLLNYTYYVVQLGDEDVNVIVPFDTDQKVPYSQNQRFSLIRWGSQCDLILPLDERFDFDLCQKDTWHCEAGIDPLVKINFK